MLHWSGEKFNQLKLKSLFWKSIEFFYNLQRYSEENNLKNLTLRFISVQNLFSSVKLYVGGWKNFDRDTEWRKNFKFPETATKKYKLMA